MCKQCLYDKFFHIARTLLENKEEIGISDQEAGKIHELKVKTKKDLIRDNAEIELIAVDIFANLFSPKSDITAINKLVDKKYELKRDAAKRFLAAFVALKGAISREQMLKAKALCKGEGHAGAGEGKGHCCR